MHHMCLASDARGSLTEMFPFKHYVNKTGVTVVLATGICTASPWDPVRSSLCELMLPKQVHLDLQDEVTGWEEG